MPRSWPLMCCLAAAGSVLAAGPLLAQQPASDRDAETVAGSVQGTLIDSRTGEPVPVAQVRLSELGRSELSHSDGSFHFDRVAPGTYTISAARIGYAPAEQTVLVANDATTRVTMTMTASAIDVAGVVVTGTGSERSAAETYRPTTALGGAELRRKLSSSVAATLAGEPGISQRYNGPAAAQPVIRGLGGDRVLILEDGQRTGDLASTSADHAVTIEALTAERIEVVRGPAGLLYGSNALGGVINVVREEVPRTVPERITGVVTGQVASVNEGATGGFALTAPLGSFAVRGELSGRTADNTRTPRGDLPTSYLDGYNGGLGVSWVGARGYLGFAGRDYGMRYGVPGTFNDEVIPGGHEGGVEIDMRRSTGRMEAMFLGGIGPFESIELDGTYVRFDQDEIELGGSDGPVVGTRFRQFVKSGELMGRHYHEAGGVRVRGATGVSALDKNFSTAGSQTGSVPADQFSVAGFVFEELGLDPFHLEVGARYDWTRIAPLEEGMEDIGFIRTRDFGDFSGSASAIVDFRPGWSVGLAISRSFRTPAIEELFSNGPHLANYSFNIGNPDLKSEYGFGTDLFVRGALPRLSGELSVFRNAISDYIYHAPTGELDPRRGQFPVYRATQADAVLSGVEGRAQWEVLPRWVVDANGSFVRGTRRADEGDTPLPEIPPLHGSVGIRHDASRYFVGASWEVAAAQDRVPPPDPDAEVTNPFDQPTAGYDLFHAVAGIRWPVRGQLHTLTLQVNNVWNTEWRDHLSRIKSVAPQPGRNVQLLYHVEF
jgi:iron complex outermembrane receptor protein